MNDLTFWLWVYRISALGIISIFSYLCWKSLRRILKIRKEIYKLKKERANLRKELEEKK